jgi:hypothetical protein
MSKLEVDAKYKDKIGNFTLILVGNGYTWDFTYAQTAYMPKYTIKILGSCQSINNTTVILNDKGESCHFREHFISPSEEIHIFFNKENATMIYDMLTEHLKWSPEALAAGTADPRLMAAESRFETGAARGAAGGAAGANERKTRKSRK